MRFIARASMSPTKKFLTKLQSQNTPETLRRTSVSTIVGLTFADFSRGDKIFIYLFNCTQLQTSARQILNAQ